jgi:hypothetical protein
MTNLILKYVSCAALLGLWIALDYFKLNDPDLIMTIKGALASIGLWHAIANLQTVPGAATPAAPRSGSLPTLPLGDGS